MKQHKAMRNLEQEYEEKIYLLLRQLEEKDKGHSSSSSDEEMIRIKEDELSNMEYWMQKFEDLEKRIGEQKVLTSIENKLEPSKGTRENSTKRGNDGELKCTCRTNCSAKICSCRKFGAKCSKDCKCDGAVCMNRVVC